MFEIGSSLCDARVRQGLDLTELEADTKIRAKYLRALEEERFDLLPGDAYAKGFLRSYAERLGLDGQLYVDEYNSRFSLVEEPVLSSRPRRRHQSRLESHAVLIALAGIVAVTVLVIAAWQLGGEGGGDPATTPADSVDVIAPEPPAVAPPPATEAETVAVIEPVDLVVTARRGSSAAEIRRGTAAGELLYEGTLTRGQTKRFTGKQLWLRLGKAQNLELTLNGTRVQDAAARGAVVIVVTADGARLAGGN